MANPYTALFQEGEIRTFEEAMKNYIAQTRHDMREAPTHGPISRALHEEMRNNLDQVEDAVKHAREIYDRIMMDAIRQAVQEMRAIGNSHLEDFAKALETGDYSILSL